MLQIDRLVCLVSRPVSGSAALRQAKHLLAARTAASARSPVLHVVSGRGEDEPAVDEAVREKVGDLPGEIALETRTVGSSDDPAERSRVLGRHVEAADADLLILDSPSDRETVPPLAHDDTQVLVEALPCPIFFAGEGAPASTERILMPTDLSDESVHTLRHATELAAGYDASVVLLHVIATSPYVALTPVDRLSLGSTTLTEHRARRRLRQFVQGEWADDVAIDIRLAFGDPADHIARAAEEEADLLVISSRETKAQERPLGPVAERVLQRVSAPLFLFRAAGEALLAPEGGGANATGPPE